VPIISIVLSALLTIDLAWLAPATSGIGILIVFTGVPAFLIWNRKVAPKAVRNLRNKSSESLSRFD
jgi:hypothetical protein